MLPNPRTSVLYRTVRIVSTAHIFFFFAVLVVAGLFILGNFQEFMDSSQLMLLQILSAIGVLCFASGVWYIISLTVWMIRRRHLMLVRALAAVLSSAVGIVALLIAATLQSVTEGV